MHIDLRNIQYAYFRQLEHSFGLVYQHMQKSGANPIQYSEQAASDETYVHESAEIVDEFLEFITTFWNEVSEPTWATLEKSGCAKAIFAGAVFPEAESNVASQTGFYFDTTILPDPFVHIAPGLSLVSKAEKCRMVLLAALTALEYREIAMAEVDPPIVAVMPPRHVFDEPYRRFVSAAAQNDALKHANKILGIEFSDIKEIVPILNSSKEHALLFKSLLHPDRYLGPKTRGDAPLEVLTRYEITEDGAIGIRGASEAVFDHVISRFYASNDAFQRSRDFSAAPVIPDETYWSWYVRMLRINAKKDEEEHTKQLHILRAIETTVNNEFPWIGNLPTDVLVQLRKDGALSEIRNVLGKGLNELVTARSDNFFRTGDAIFDNLDRALREQQRKINILRDKKLMFAGRDLGSFLVVGGIALTAAITASPVYGVLAAIAGMSGFTPTMKSLKSDFASIRKEHTDINTTGIGVLFKYKT